MMFDESKTNFVAVADSLRRRHPGVHKVLSEGCANNGIEFYEVECQNIWLRDWMPVQLDEDRFIKFRYGYGKDNPQFKSLEVKRDNWRWLSGVKNSSIRLDGGNVVRYGTSAILTDIVFRHNKNLKPPAVLRRLETLLECDVTIVPAEPGDDIGHTDGICHFTPSGKLLVGDYRYPRERPYWGYHRILMKALNGFDIEIMPNAYDRMKSVTEKEFRNAHPEADTFNPGYGYYINYLHVGNVVFFPIFRIEEDAQVRAILKQNYPKSVLIPVDCCNVSMEGGLINCLTANYIQ